MIARDETMPHGRLAPRFVAAYHQSLSDYRFFYDDIAEVGNPASAEHAFYYVPGISGSPGQMRFALPNVLRVLGSRIYMKALDVPAFSATAPIWDKYTLPNTEEKLEQLRDDLSRLLRRFARLVVVCSSNGMYDFLAAATAFPAGELESRVHLTWVSCAPDEYSSTTWERVFFPLNGVVAHGHKWFAYPNHGALRRFNPETTEFFSWRDGHQRRRFDKLDLESRFHYLGLQWDYISTSQLGEIARYVTSQIDRPWTAPVDTLIAAHDGYWQGVSRDTVLETVRRYAPRARCAVRAGSHVSVVTPTNLTQLFAKTFASMHSMARGYTRPLEDVVDDTTAATVTY